MNKYLIMLICSGLIANGLEGMESMVSRTRPSRKTKTSSTSKKPAAGSASPTRSRSTSPTGSPTRKPLESMSATIDLPKFPQNLDFFKDLDLNIQAIATKLKTNINRITGPDLYNQVAVFHVTRSLAESLKGTKTINASKDAELQKGAQTFVTATQAFSESIAKTKASAVNSKITKIISDKRSAKQLAKTANDADKFAYFADIFCSGNGSSAKTCCFTSTNDGRRNQRSAHRAIRITQRVKRSTQITDYHTLQEPREILGSFFCAAV